MLCGSREGEQVTETDEKGGTPEPPKQRAKDKLLSLELSPFVNCGIPSAQNSLSAHGRSMNVGSKQGWQRESNSGHCGWLTDYGLDKSLTQTRVAPQEECCLLRLCLFGHEG